MVKSFTCCAGGLGSIQGRGTQHFQMTFISEISAYLSIACEIKSEGALYSVFYAEASKRPQTWELRVPCVDSQPYYLIPCTVHIFLLLITNHLIVMFSHTLHHSMFYRWEACPFICHMSTTIPIAHYPKTYIPLAIPWSPYHLQLVLSITIPFIFRTSKHMALTVPHLPPFHPAQFP